MQLQSGLSREPNKAQDGKIAQIMKLILCVKNLLLGIGEWPQGKLKTLLCFGGGGRKFVKFGQNQLARALVQL